MLKSCPPLFGHLTDPGFWTSLQLEDLAREVEERYGLALGMLDKECRTPRRRENLPPHRVKAEIHGLPFVHEQANNTLSFCKSLLIHRTQMFQ